MAHYAHVNTSNANTVTKVIVISNEEEDVLKSEANVDAFIKSSFGGDGAVSYTHLTLPTNREV